MLSCRAARRLVFAGVAVVALLALANCSGGEDDPGVILGGGTARSLLYVSGNGSDELLAYADANTVSGSAAPANTVSGGLTTLNGPRGIAVDMARNQLYVANSAANAILAFHTSRTVTGNVAPDRTITGASLNLPSALFLDVSNNRLFVVTTGGDAILVYDNASGLNGAAAPARILAGAATGLSAPLGVHVDLTRNLLYVANGDNRILVFANAAGVAGNTAPSRIMSGLAGSGGIFVDVQADRLYLAATAANAVLVFDDASVLDGSVTPDRTISGGNTQLNLPRELFLDLGTDRLYVTNPGGDSILVFNSASSVSGNAAPNRTVTLAAGTDPWGLFVDVTPVVIGSTATLDGFVSFDGTSYTAEANGGSPRTGDDEAFLTGNRSRQLFSFDLSGLPAGVTVGSATLRLYQAEQTGTPYNDLGSVTLEHVDYGDTLQAGSDDFSGGLLASFASFSTDSSEGYRARDVTARVANDLAAFRGRSQYRLRFSPVDINFDFASDFVRFTDAEDSCCAKNRPPQLSFTLQP